MLRTLSIVVPCHNEAASLPRLHEETLAVANELSSSIELILVDDGSRDDTLVVARELAARDPRVRVISFSRNFGKEAAMLAGLKAARGDAVAIMDADLQHPPQMLRDMVAVLLNEDVDQVVARRSRDGESMPRRLMSRLFYRVVNSLVDVQLVDGVGDFRLLSRRAVDALLAMPEQNRFSKGLFSWIGFPTRTVTYSNVLRGEGESSWTFRALVNYGIDGIVSFNQRPLRLVFQVGLAAILLALGHLAWLLVSWVRSGVSQPGYLTTMAAITLFSGVQLISLAILAEYVGRIYREVKQRPHYLIAETRNDPDGDRGLRSGEPTASLPLSRDAVILDPIEGDESVSTNP